MVLLLVVILRGLEFHIFLEDAVDDFIPLGFALDEGGLEQVDLLFHEPVLFVEGLELGRADGVGGGVEGGG